jgi:hypothetical protein
LYKKDHECYTIIHSKTSILIYFQNINTSTNMHLLLPITISLASLASFATAFTLPAGLEDGNYAAYYNATGHEVHVKASDLPNMNVEAFSPPYHAARSLLAKRQDAESEIFCGCGFIMDHGDCDNAVSMLKGQFPAFVEANVNFYSISSSVVVIIDQKEDGRVQTLTNLTRPSSVTQELGWR